MQPRIGLAIDHLHHVRDQPVARADALAHRPLAHAPVRAQPAHVGPACQQHEQRGHDDRALDQVGDAIDGNRMDGEPGGSHQRRGAAGGPQWIYININVGKV